MVNITDDTAQFGEMDADGIPLELEGYTRLKRLQTISIIEQLAAIEFGVDDEIYFVNNLDSAATTVQRYVYNEENDTIEDLATGTVYNDLQGTWTGRRWFHNPAGLLGWRWASEFYTLLQQCSDCRPIAAGHDLELHFPLPNGADHLLFGPFYGHAL